MTQGVGRCGQQLIIVRAVLRIFGRTGRGRRLGAIRGTQVSRRSLSTMLVFGSNSLTSHWTREIPDGHRVRNEIRGRRGDTSDHSFRRFLSLSLSKPDT